MRRPAAQRRMRWVVAGFGAVLLACTNNPYPNDDATARVLYAAYPDAPRTLDPAIAYTTRSHAFTGLVYDTLLEYHFLKRPFTLIPGMATAVPEPVRLPDGRTAYRFQLRDDLLYADDPCFALGGAGRTTRQVVASDIAFQMARLMDPALDVQVVEPFSNIAGTRAFAARLAARREADATFAALPVHEQYRQVGPIEGVRVRGERELEIVLGETYPQILYWFAMPFTSPLPWEAVAYYDGEEHDGQRHDRLADHPVGSGPYRIVRYDKQSRIVLEKNPNWYGIRHPEWKAPGAVYPSEGEPGDVAAGLLSPRLVGRPLPFIDRLEFRREKETIPAFTKFLQGYYDASAVIRESFDKVVFEDRISPEMEARGIQLEKSVRPSVFYIGFNMDNPTVGHAAGERGRKLRQAMSLVIDSEEYKRLFLNGRGVPAQTPIPPGLFGYEPDYRNPYRVVDIPRAQTLLAEAGYPDGIDPETGEPLALTFDTSDTSAQGRLRYTFFVNAWRQIGIDVRIDATNYNQFQEKMRKGGYQIFQWGWIADYPDPQNFYFLLDSQMARSRTGGPNSTNFSDPRFDALFHQMAVRDNDDERLRIIREMRSLLEEERAWIELYHAEDYALFHGWTQGVKPFGMSYPMTKYRDIDPLKRAAQRTAWNRPVLWPLYALTLVGVAIVVPGIRTFLRERQ